MSWNLSLSIWTWIWLIIIMFASVLNSWIEYILGFSFTYSPLLLIQVAASVIGVVSPPLTNPSFKPCYLWEHVRPISGLSLVERVRFEPTRVVSHVVPIRVFGLGRTRWELIWDWDWVWKEKEKKRVKVFRRRKLKIILRSSECLGSKELLSYALKKKMATKTEKIIRAIRV